MKNGFLKQAIVSVVEGGCTWLFEANSDQVLKQKANLQKHPILEMAIISTGSLDEIMPPCQPY
jgi:hypothetical protein